MTKVDEPGEDQAHCPTCHGEGTLAKAKALAIRDAAWEKEKLAQRRRAALGIIAHGAIGMSLPFVAPLPIMAVMGWYRYVSDGALSTDIHNGVTQVLVTIAIVIALVAGCSMVWNSIEEWYKRER